MINSYNQQLIKQREKRDLSIWKAARGIGISSFTLFLYENGYFRPSKKAITKIEKFYDCKLDFSNGKEYASRTAGRMMIKNKKKKLFIYGGLSIIFASLIATGSLLFSSSASITSNHYGPTYTAVQKKAFEEGESGRDILTDLEYFYLRGDESSISFYTANSMLFFNKSVSSANVNFKYTRPEIGDCRMIYQFGGDLSKNSYICTFTFSSTTARLYFTADVFYTNEHITTLPNVNIVAEGSLKYTDELGVFLFNYKIDDIIDNFDYIIKTATGSDDQDFYHDFLSSREMGRISNFNRQISGLLLLFPSIIALCSFVVLFLYTLVSRVKIDVVEDEEEDPKSLPKDININFGVPDYVIIWITRIIGFSALFLLLLCFMGKLFLDLPPLFSDKSFLQFLKISFIAAPILRLLTIVRSNPTEKTIFTGAIRFSMLHIGIASLETAILGVTAGWGYDIGNLIYDYVPSTIFLFTALSYLLSLFLFFTPISIRDKKNKITVWRLLSIIPLLLIIANIIIGSSYVLFYGVKRNIYLQFWVSNPNLAITIVGVLAIFTIFFLKSHYKKKYGDGSLFFNGNLYTVINNMICSGLMVLVTLIDLAFKYSEYGYYLGLGNNIWLLVLIPIVLLCKFGPNSSKILHLTE